MKTKNGIIKIGSLVLVLSVFVYFILSANGRTGKNNDQGMFEIKKDTLKTPDVGITEQRMKTVTIVNGKKKVQETIIKMKGDSVIEKKVVENEEDAPDNDGSMMFNFSFGDENMDIDSLSGGMNQRFNFGVFPMDSMMNQFRMQFDSPGFNFNFGDNFDTWPDDIVKQFQDDENGFSPFNGNMDKFLDEMFKRYNFDHDEIPGWNDNHNPKSNTPKSLNEIIRDNLLNDGFISDIDQKYKVEIDEKGLKIDGKKQDKRVFEKYKKVIEDNTGVELEDEFSFNFNNNKKVDIKTKRI